MNRPGRNTIIFHMQIGNMHVVLGSYMFVEVDSCGDGECQRTEVCEVCPEMMGPLERVCVVCPQDCCLLALALILGSFFAILLFIVVLIVVVITCCIVTCVCLHKRRRMKDESWVISYNDITISNLLSIIAMW
jgi:hypothetical protein